MDKVEILNIAKYLVANSTDDMFKLGVFEMASNVLEVNHFDKWLLAAYLGVIVDCD